MVIVTSVFGFQDQSRDSGYFLCAAECSPTSVSTPCTYYALV